MPPSATPAPAAVAAHADAPSARPPLFGRAVDRAPKDQVGLALGAWGAVQATAAGAGVALGGIGRDVVQALASRGVFGDALATPATGYAFVYGLEIVLLLATVAAITALLRSEARQSAARYSHHPPSMEFVFEGLQILFIIWTIVFVFWLVRQFAAYNKDKVRKNVR